MSENNPIKERFWFVARTIAQAELKMRTYFEDHDIECFVPIKKEIRKWKGEMTEREVPIIHNLLFFKADYTLANSVFSLNARRIYRVRSGNALLRVPDNQMEPFIRFVNEYHGKVRILESAYVVGDKMMIRTGPFAGTVGKVTQIDDKDYFTICLEGLLVAAVKFPKSNLIKVEEVESKSSPKKYDF